MYDDDNMMMYDVYDDVMYGNVCYIIIYIHRTCSGSCSIYIYIYIVHTKEGLSKLKDMKDGVKGIHVVGSCEVGGFLKEFMSFSWDFP